MSSACNKAILLFADISKHMIDIVIWQLADCLCEWQQKPQIPMYCIVDITQRSAKKLWELHVWIPRKTCFYELSLYPCTTLFSQFDREASRQPKLKIDKNIHSLVHFIHPHYSTLSLLLQYSSSPLLITVQQQQFTCSTLHATSHWI